MNLHTLHEPPPDWLGAALERFEQQFEYPLGPASTFRISHGRDYMPFFSAMGHATLLVAEQAGEVLGTLARVERWIEFRGVCPMRQLVHYLADLKVSPKARGSRFLASLMLEAKRQIEQTTSRSCYAIVMNGTGKVPTDYTGRLSIPTFEVIAEIMILRIAAGQGTALPSVTSLPPKPACIVTGGQREHRSLMSPIRIADFVWLEDTRRSKRLWRSDGSELMSAHLGGFHFQEAAEGAAVVRRALSEAQRHGFPALFVAQPLSQHHALRQELTDLHITEAPASIYGYRIRPDYDWWVDTAEI
jgi:hypothetical protein